MSETEAEKLSPAAMSLLHACGELRVCAHFTNSAPGAWGEAERVQVRNHLKLAEDHVSEAMETMQSTIGRIKETVENCEAASRTTSDSEFGAEAESRAEALRWVLDVLAGKADGL